MPYVISKRFEFAAAHHLGHLPPQHKCRRVHGHNYTVTLVLSSDEVDTDGFVEDYGRLDDVKTYIAAYLDHRDLNQYMAMPTAECLAQHLYEQFAERHPRLSEVIVSETGNTTASYRP